MFSSLIQQIEMVSTNGGGRRNSVVRKGRVESIKITRKSGI